MKYLPIIQELLNIAFMAAVVWHLIRLKRVTIIETEVNNEKP